MYRITSVLLILILSAGIQHLIPGTSAHGNTGEGYFLSLNDNMKDLLDREVLPVRDEKKRLDKIVDLIFDRSVVGFEYSGKKTFSASETFENRSGNCLSYTTMFIAMARYARLNASFQEVSDFSDWNRQGDLIIFSSHMNSIVEIGSNTYEVDFQYRSEKKFWNRKVVDDRRAEAHYFNNIGAEALLENNFTLAGKYLEKSIGIDGTFSYSWTNLGVLLMKTDQMNEAEASFVKAMALDKNNHTAKINLAGLLESRGDMKGSLKLKNQIRKILNKNPFYHFNLGVKEYNLNNFKASVTHFKRAIKKDPTKPEFYIRLSAAYYKLGNLKMSRKYLKKGQKYAESDKEKDRYRKKLEYIYIKFNQKEESK